MWSLTKQSDFVICFMAVTHSEEPAGMEWSVVLQSMTHYKSQMNSYLKHYIQQQQQNILWCTLLTLWAVAKMEAHPQ